MEKKNLGIVLTVAFVAGFFGGLLSNYFLAGNPALAQKTPRIPKSISAEEFRVVDARGRTRAILHVTSPESKLNPKDKTLENLPKELNVAREHDDLDGPHLTFLDDFGIPMISLGYDIEGGMLTFQGEKGDDGSRLSNSRFSMFAGPTSVILSLDDRGAQSSSQFSMNAGPTRVNLSLDDRGAQLEAEAHKDDQTTAFGMAVYNGDTVPRSKLKEKLMKILPQQLASLFIGTFSNSKGTEPASAELSLAMNGDPSLKLTDKGGLRAALGKTELITPRTGTTETRSVSSLVLFGPDGKVLWSAP